MGYADTNTDRDTESPEATNEVGQSASNAQLSQARARPWDRRDHAGLCRVDIVVLDKLLYRVKLHVRFDFPWKQCVPACPPE